MDKRITKVLKEILVPLVKEHLNDLKHTVFLRKSLEKDESVYCPWLR